MRTPGKIRPYLKRRLSPLSYYFGDGSWAFRPTSIKLYVNNTCNACCPMCDIGRGKRESVFYSQMVQSGDNLFSTDACRRLAESVRHFRPAINISGVEPLMHPDIVEMVQIFKGYGLSVAISTNGILLPDVAEVLVSAGIDSISVSIDGPEPVHDRIRGRGAHRRAVEGLRRALDCRTQRGTDTEITCSFIITHFNFSYLVEAATAMIEDENVDCMNFIHPYFVTPLASERHNSRYHGLGLASPANLTEEELRLIDIEALWSQMRILQRRNDKGRFRFNIYLPSQERVCDYYRNPERFMGSSRCLIPWTRATVLANGDTAIHNRCFHYRTGNIFHDSFDGIWNGDRYRAFRRALRGKGLFPVCARCCGSISGS